MTLLAEGCQPKLFKSVERVGAMWAVSDIVVTAQALHNLV